MRMRASLRLGCLSTYAPATATVGMDKTMGTDMMNPTCASLRLNVVRKTEVKRPVLARAANCAKYNSPGLIVGSIGSLTGALS